MCREHAGVNTMIFRATQQTRDDGPTQQTQNICKTFTQSWTKLGRRCVNVIQMFRVCWESGQRVVFAGHSVGLFPANTKH